MTVLIITVSLSICVSALCSLLESVLYSTRVISLEASQVAGDRRAEAMRAFKREVDRPLAAILILNTLANTAGAALAGWAAAEVWGAGSLGVFSLVFTLGILFFSEIIPKTVGAVYWRVLWRSSVFPLKIMVLLLSPFIWLTRMVTRIITRRVDHRDSTVSEDEILAAAHLGQRGGEISKMEADMIQNIIELEEVQAKDIMTPRTVMLALDGDLTLAEAKAEAMEWAHTRVPVWVGTQDDIMGYVLKDNICRAPSEGAEGEIPVKELAKPVRFVPGTANALNLLNSFLKSREHLTLVVDEYGGIMGLVTLEDVFESLVGTEIVDEKDLVADLQALARRQGKAILDQGRDGDR